MRRARKNLEGDKEDLGGNKGAAQEPGKAICRPREALEGQEKLWEEVKSLHESQNRLWGGKLRASVRGRISFRRASKSFGRRLRVYVKDRIGFGRRSITLDVMLRMLSGCRRGIA